MDIIVKFYPRHPLPTDGLAIRRRPPRNPRRQKYSKHHPHSFSTVIRPPGTSPKTSGAYIASTLVAGRAKSPALLRRTVYSTEKLPLGTRA